MEENLNPQAELPQAKPMMPFWTAVKTCFKKYFDFKGRARRSEYWWFSLFGAILYFVWGLLIAFIVVPMGFEAATGSDVVTDPTPLFMFLLAVITWLPLLFIIIPLYAALTRRLHDSGHSGWWVVASLVLTIIYYALHYYFVDQYVLSDLGSSGVASHQSLGMLLLLTLPNLVIGIIILIFSIQDSEKHENRFGPSPKYQ